MGLSGAIEVSVGDFPFCGNPTCVCLNLAATIIFLGSPSISSFLFSIPTDEMTFGPSGVSALPLGVAAELYLVLFFIYLFISGPHTFLPEGVVLGL